MLDPEIHYLSVLNYGFFIHVQDYTLKQILLVLLINFIEQKNKTILDYMYVYV